MKKFCIVSIVLLFLWFTMDMTGFSIGDRVLVESAWKSIDGVWWIIFVVLSILFLMKERIGKYFLTGFVFLWAITQFMFHWYYTLFGVSDKKITSYNNFFKETYHIIPPSDTILIPDFYHIVLHILILITMVSLILFIIEERKTANQNSKIIG